MPESQRKSRAKHQSVPVRSADSSLAARVIEAQDEERRKISRELHDSVGQSLAAAKMSIGKFKRRRSIGDDTELDEALRIIDDTITEVRTLSHLLHPPNLDLMGLRPSLAWLGEGFQQRTGIHTSFEAPEKLPEFSAGAATAIFRIAQEALTNIHRHAQANHVTLRLTQSADEFQMEVNDDGKGFADLEACRQGIGILGMQERVAELGGILQVESGANAGSSVFVTVPLAPLAIQGAPIPPQSVPRKAVARILVVDDHPAIREGVRTILSACPDLEICGEASTAGEALQLAEKHRPDAILLDLQLGSENGWSVVRALRAVNSPTKILVFSHHEERYVIPAARNSGCAGYVSKSSSSQELINAVRTVLDGGSSFESPVALRESA